ncbi:hypothetical protein K7432_011883 [Basidiobolus ranarum]|uniref:SGNH domain-containing protein n=1 Tax=Basidiobolus ranarum TaxID=34480 RepID=A0ABR2WLI8_9FUNG
MPLVKSSNITFGWICQKIGFLIVLGILFSLVTIFSRISPRRTDFDLEYSQHSKSTPEEEELASYMDQYFPPQCPNEDQLFDKYELSRKNFYFDCEILTRPERSHWRVLNCKSTERCGLGHLVIQPYDYSHCQKFQEKQLSQNQTFDTYLKEAIGPDAFLGKFHGGQIYAIDQWIFTDDCAYKLPYQLTTKEDIFLDLIHVGSEYNAITENIHSTKFKPQVILQNHNLHLCEECVSTKYSKQPTPCSVKQELKGTLKKSSTGNIVWKPAGCYFPKIIEDCLKNRRKILFLGDGYVHTLMNEFLDRLTLSKDVEKTTRKLANIEGTFLNFSGQLTSEMQSELAKSDTIVLNLPRIPEKEILDYVESTRQLLQQLRSISNQSLDILLIQNMANAPHSINPYQPHFYQEQLGNDLLSKDQSIRTINVFQESLALSGEEISAEIKSNLLTSIIVDQLMLKLEICS